MTSRRLVLDEFLPYRLSFTANLVSEVIASTYAALFDLRIPEWRVVAHVAEREVASQQEICAATRMDKVTVSRAAIALVGRGLLGREAHPGDKRSHLLALTEAGRTLYAAVAPKALELEERVFADFDPAERAAAEQLLRRIDAAALAVLDVRV